MWKPVLIVSLTLLIVGAAVIAVKSASGQEAAMPTAELTDSRLRALAAFRAKPKYVPGGLYTGVQDPLQRQRFIARLDALASELEPLASVPDPKPKLLKVLERAWPTFAVADTEDREQTLGYFQELMSILGVESSDGLLNRLMYDFDPPQASGARIGSEAVPPR